MLAFQSISLSRLRAGLAEQASSIDAGQGFNVSTSYNFLLVVGSDKSASDISTLVESLSPIRPGRLFVVQLVEDSASLECSISYICHRLDKDSSICSDIIKSEVGQDSLPQFYSVLRALLLTGRKLITYFVDCCAFDKPMIPILEMTDVLVFDSSSLGMDVADFFNSSVFKKIDKIVDLRWLWLGVWREHLKLSFDGPFAASLIDKITEIELEAPIASLDTWLFVHWLVSRLGLKVVQENGSRLEVADLRGRKVNLVIKDNTCEISYLPLGLKFKFLGPQTASVVLESELRELRTEFSTHENLVVSSKYDDFSSYQLVFRFFEAGETINQYKKYLGRAISSARSAIS